MGDVLRNQVVDNAIDSLVGGAYGHGRLRALMLGGVTRALLERTDASLGMSH